MVLAAIVQGVVSSSRDDAKDGYCLASKSFDCQWNGNRQANQAKRSNAGDEVTGLPFCSMLLAYHFRYSTETGLSFTGTLA
jgi:hypothetical protein